MSVAMHLCMYLYVCVNNVLKYLSSVYLYVCTYYICISVCYVCIYHSLGKFTVEYFCMRMFVVK